MKELTNNQQPTTDNKFTAYVCGGVGATVARVVEPFSLLPIMPKKSFSELINSPGMPVLVDFYADWCGPCKTMAPILEQVANQHQGKLRVIKIDVDRNQAVAQQFRVQGIPTLILFHQGQPVWRQSGVVPAPQLTQVVQQFVGK